MYDLAWGVAKDERLAFVYYEKAAQQGDMYYQLHLGITYHLGRLCEQSCALAAHWYEKAAGQGNAHAMASLGSLYHNGQGVSQSHKRAFELFQQSRALGNTHPFLQLSLGICYEHGHGVAKDYLEARRFYAMASAQGDADATDKANRLDESVRTKCPLIGKRVVVTGTSREDINGRTGATTSFDHARVRYVVELDDDTGENGIQGKLKLKPGNLAW